MGTAGGFDHDVVVIGTGFGGTMTALTLAREFKRRAQGEDVLMLERGTWWTTPVETVADKTLAAKSLLEANGQPVQFWSSAEHFKGFVDIFTRCLRRKGNEDGLYELTTFGRRGLFGALSKNDGVSILRASGVGGGSLVYANVTIRPPDFVLEDRRWPLGWSPQERDGFYARARDAIGHGVLWALDQHYDGAPDYPIVPDPDKGPSINTGLSRIAARTAGVKPQFATGVNGAKRIDLTHSKGLGVPPRQDGVDSWNALWIDRARVFQTAMSELTPDYGTCESSINDVDPDAGPHVNKDGQPQNYCERQGRCIVGCLPGARHTLNKQLMKAIYAPAGKPPAPLHGILDVEALCEVQTIAARPGGGYEVRYLKRDPHNPKQSSERVVSAGRVVVAAGTVGTNEILLRCRQTGTLPGLSAAVGKGFSTNGDSLQFLENCTERLSLTRGPVTTSFAHFAEDPERFHTIEDNGIPRALAALAGHGVPLVKSLSKGRRPRLFVLFATARYVLGRIPAAIRAVLRNAGARQPEFASEDEQLSNMMCVATMGREASVGEFRLGKGLDTTLRVARPDGTKFKDDKIYRAIDHSLRQFATQLTSDANAKFRNPFTERAMLAFGGQAITLSHPLGGCRMAASAIDGVVDEHGRVFDTTTPDDHAVHDGLYVADGSMIPTALGVNPSLTISALALRVADGIVNELPRVAAQPAAPAPGVVLPAP
jgi:choline dehydrogenase-like flavoprotein